MKGVGIHLKIVQLCENVMRAETAGFRSVLG